MHYDKEREEYMSNQDDLKLLMQNRIRCCERSGALGEAKLWQSALDRIEELEKQLEPDMFWNYDYPESSFDSLQELADYHLDSWSDEKVNLRVMHAASIPCTEYSFKFNEDEHEWEYDKTQN